MKPTETEIPDDPQERARLLGEIRGIYKQLGLLGVDLSALRNTARAMAVSQADGKAGIPTAVLEASRSELIAILRGFREQETAHAGKVSNLRKAFYAAALAALFGGAITQRACDPIGKVHAYLTTPNEEPEVAP